MYLYKSVASGYNILLLHVNQISGRGRKYISIYISGIKLTIIRIDANIE